MAKKSLKKFNKQDLMLIALVFLVVFSNMVWVLVIQDKQRQIDQISNDNFNTLVNVNGLRTCYNKQTNPCPDPQTFDFTK
jgi:hypothetical protein